MVDAQFAKHVTAQKIVLPKNPGVLANQRLEDAPILSGTAN